MTGAPPELLVTHRVLAKYPEEAKNARVQGEVPIELTVDEKGEVTDARVIDGPEPLRNAALDAARQWRFAPPPQAPVAVRVVFRFNLLPDENPKPVTNDEHFKQQGTNRGPAETKIESEQATTLAADVASALDVSNGVKGESKIGKEAGSAGGVTYPVAIYKPEPPYPDEARQAKIEGTVKLWIDIDAEGKVSDVSVAQPAGYGFDEKAAETARTWKFKPALRDGVPVPARVMVEVHLRKEEGYVDFLSAPVQAFKVLTLNEGEYKKPWYPAGTVVQELVPIYTPTPAYTTEAKKAGTRGPVTIQTTINADGKVSDVQVVKSAGYGLDESAAKTIRTWKFKPPLQNGVPATVRIPIQILFNP